MIKVIPFRQEHAVTLITTVKDLEYLKPYMDSKHLNALVGDKAFTAVSIKDGSVLACAGIVQYWDSRGEAWAMFDPNFKECFLAVHNAVKRFLNVCPMKRIEAVVDLGYERGHRWIKLLGFDLEAPLLKAYRPDGRDCALYAKVSE
jgi:hypothetical protein